MAPGETYWKVEASTIGCINAPLVGSGSCPAMVAEAPVGGRGHETKILVFVPHVYTTVPK